MLWRHKNRQTVSNARDTRGSMEFDIGTNKVYLLEKFVTGGNSKSATCPVKYELI